MSLHTGEHTRQADDVTNAKIAVQPPPGATSPPTAAQLVAQQAALEAAKAAAIERLQAEAHELVASTDARLKEIAEELRALGHRRVGRPKGAETPTDATTGT